MNQQKPQSSESPQHIQGPGDKLQTARISIGMTLKEVASKMHLSTGILTSLEENNFEDITAPIFVKGYLRAYSRLVNINEEEIIQQYATDYMDGDPPISSTSNTSPEINADDSKVKWITYLVIFGLIALLSIWWWNRYQQAPEMVSLESGNNPQSESLAIGKSENSIDQSTSSNETVKVDTTQSSLQMEIEQVANSIELKQDQTAILNADNAESNNLIQSTAIQQEPVAVEQELSTVEETIAVETKPEEIVAEDLTPEIAPIQNDNNLVITVNSDTWASIRDADGKKLVYDLLKSGEEISVTGKAPFKAFLGNGYGVTMKYKGKNIDLSGIIRSDNTARLKIGR